MNRPTLLVGRQSIRRLVRASIVPALALAALTATIDVGYGAERVGVRGGLHATFARLVFDWSGPVAYQVAATDQQLTVTFERPMEGQFEPARRAISDYIGNVRLEDDGKRVVIELKRPVRTSHFVNEQSVVVDLRPTGGAAATAAPEVPVQISDRNGYTRIVFDWPVRTDYRFSQKDARISLSFARPGALALPTLSASGTALVTNMQSTRRGADPPCS